jgi:hypothetical protein
VRFGRRGGVAVSLDIERIGQLAIAEHVVGCDRSTALVDRHGDSTARIHYDLIGTNALR